MRACRCCGITNEFTPLLSYLGMPSIIQNLPLDRCESLKKVVDLNIIQCASCGLVQLDGEYYVPYYKDVIRSSSVSDSMMDFRKKQFSIFADKYNCRDKTYVEFGCGGGEYLRIMQSVIKDSFGIENNPKAVLNCRSQGMTIQEGYVEDIKLQKKANIFGCFNFLEHIPQPVEFLKKVRNLISNDAVGLVEVPNFEMMAADGVSTDFSSEHLSYFTEATLQTTLTLAGFDVLSIRKVWHGHIISAEVSPRIGLDALRFNKGLNSLKASLCEVIKNIDPHQVAVWGAGHQSITMMLQLELSNRVGLIVDSAQTKQGRYAPGIGIQIHSPEVLRDKEIKILIINASSYSSEVLHSAKKSFPMIDEIYIVDNMTLVKG